MAVFLAVLCGLGLLVLLFKPVFGNRGEFLRCLKYYLTPDIISLFRGKYGEDTWAELKLFVWFVPPIVAGLLVYFGVKSI